MKPSRLLILLAFPFALFACATAVSPTTSGAGGSTGAGGDGGSSSSEGGGGATTVSTSTGMSGTCSKKGDCAAFDDVCNVGNCVNGMCAKTPANDGLGCDDGMFCTESDVCQNGACMGGTPKFCPSPDSCHLGVCDEALKDCGPGIPGNDGAPCVDDDACTKSGTCNNGNCQGGAPIDCSFLDGPCSIGACDSALGCIVTPKAEGAACDDNQYCTIDDTCQAGMCTGAPNPCAPPGNPCLIGVCNEANKSCVSQPGNDGMMCDDGNDCTGGSTCAAGKCMGGMPANDGMFCLDKDGCTLGTKCTNGTCANPSSVINQCVNLDGCCPPGCVNQGDGDCSLTKWSEGTNAWPDQACNPFNSFGTCDTNAQNHADAWASKVCQGNGYSLGIWTGNKAPGCNGEISMYCGGSIPCNPIFENSCAPGDQTKVEITCFP